MLCACQLTRAVDAMMLKPASSKNKNPSSYRRYLLGMVMLLLTFYTALWQMVDEFILDRYLKLEEERVYEHMTRVTNVIEREEEFLKRMLVDEAYWDQTWADAAQIFPNEFAKQTTIDTFASGRLTAIVMTNTAGKMLYAQGYDLSAEQLMPVPPVIIDNLAALQQLVAQGKASSAQAGILFDASDPFLVAVAPILRSDASGPTRGMMLYARRFDATKLAQLENLTQVALQLDSVASDRAEPNAVLIDRQGGRVHGHIHLPDLLGRGSGTLTVSVGRHIYTQGRQSVVYFLSWAITAGLFFSMIGLHLLKRMKNADQKLVERYRVLFDGSPIPMWVYDAETLKFVDVNRAAISQYGYVREEFLQLTILNLRPEGDTGALREGVARLVQEGVSSEPAPRSVGVWTHCRKDGSRLQVDVHVVPFIREGRTAILASAFDVTEKLVNEKALRLSEERYRHMFENTPLPMWVVDMQSLRYVDVNQTAVDKYGYSREEFLTMSIMDIRPAEDVARLQESVVQPQPQQEAGIWRHRSKDGRIFQVEIVLKDMFFDGQGARLVIANDVTEKEALRKQADQISRLAAIGELAAGVAHEINNPNGMILRNLDFVADLLADALPLLEPDSEDLQLGGLDYPLVCAQVPQLVEDMRRGAGHIRDIVRDLKDFSRVEVTAFHEIFELNEAVAAAVRLVDGPLRKGTDAFELRLAENLPQVCGNLRQIEQVVLNLIMNALQALPERSRAIGVSTFFDPDAQILVVEVKDQGRGIAPEHLEQITNPFFTTRRETGGTGLGLSVSSRIVRQHQGQLQFESRLGQGTKVRLKLPVAVAPTGGDL